MASSILTPKKAHSANKVQSTFSAILAHNVAAHSMIHEASEACCPQAD
jgi:hypothetical protein